MDLLDVNVVAHNGTVVGTARPTYVIIPRAATQRVETGPICYRLGEQVHHTAVITAS